jgi:hypothetical protein
MNILEKDYSMAKYRKKPVVIEACQFNANETSFRGDLGVYEDPASPTGYSIDTLEGKHEVTIGDWIIVGVVGEKYPCKPHIFEATYEPVEEGVERERVHTAEANAEIAHMKGLL